MSFYKNITGYGPRATENERYYSIFGTGMGSSLEKGNRFDNKYYKLGNYFLDEEVASKRAFVEIVSRKIFSFSLYCAQNKPIDNSNGSCQLYYVDYDYEGDFFKVGSVSSDKMNWQASYFVDKEDCDRAVKEIANPMKEYYTKSRQDYLDWKANNSK